MGKRIDDDKALFLLDQVLAIRRHLESENLPAQRMQMSCGHLDTPLGAVPIIVQTPFPVIVQTRADIERAAFARFGAERPWPEAHRGLLGSLQALVDAPIVCLARAFMRVVMHPDECILTLGTQGKPGWTNQSNFVSSVFDYLESMSGIGGVLVHFECPFDRPLEPREPKGEQPISWMDIHKQGVGERALAMAKRPRDRLILLLAVHQRMRPAEINALNLSQVRQKLGRDGRLRVYLKKRLVRKKAVADALLQFRKRDRMSFWDPHEPMFRTGKTTRLGRSRRMGTKALEAFIERYAERAIKELPPAPTIKEPTVTRVRPPMFWVSDMAYSRRT